MDSLLDFLRSGWVQYPAVFLLGLIVGVRLDTLARRKEREPVLEQARTDLAGLADEAEAVANGLHKIIGETASRPPTHPSFGIVEGDAYVQMWQQTNHDRRETALREYRAAYATRAWRVIETARKYVEVMDGEVWMVSHIHGPDDLDHMARLLAAISARLRAVQVQAGP